MLYFDNAATSWPKPESVYQTHDRILREGGNAGRGAHRASLEAGRILFHTRELLARLFGLPYCERLIFTQNITESLNIGLQGLLQPGDHVLITSLEHNAVIRPLEFLKEKNIAYTIIPCDHQGILDISTINAYFQPNTRLFCCTHASNVLGTILPLAEIGRIVKQHQCLFMVDSAQSAGVLPLNVKELQIDFLAFTGHKSLMGPQGVGGFYVVPEIELRPLIYGGTGTNSLDLGQPKIWPEGMESGTRNVPGIAALGAGVEFILQEGIARIRSHEVELMRMLLDGLSKLPSIQILGPPDPMQRVGLVSCVFQDRTPEKVCFALDREYGIAARAGLHCAPLAHQTAGTKAQGALRFSLNYFQTQTDIQSLLAALAKVLQ